MKNNQQLFKNTDFKKQKSRPIDLLGNNEGVRTIIFAHWWLCVHGCLDLSVQVYLTIIPQAVDRGTHKNFQYCWLIFVSNE